MPNLQAQHPERERLIAFGLGKLSEDDSKPVETHLAECEACRTLLEAAPADSLVQLLQSPGSDTLADAAPSASTADGASPSESLPPLYQRVAQILKKEEPAPSDATLPVSMGPRELEGHPRYHLLAPLGAGGMGTVYKAEHRLMERVVALKMVNPLFVNRPGAAERFEREVKAAAKLVHPNIVTAFDAEKVGDMHVLVMEFVEGQTLAELIAARRELPVARACDYVRQTALGLAHALERGMVHRDIKPQNLMLTPKGEIKILDFGLARFVSEQAPAGASTEHGTLMGSPDYMAPEQGHDARSADQRADIYSMGCTLYHLLAGQVPFPEVSLLAKLEAHRDRQPFSLNRLRADVPAELAAVVEKMMAKDPAKRYQTPAEVAEALRPFTTTVKPPPTRAGKRPGTRRVAVYTLAMVALLSLFGVGYWIAPIVFRVETPAGTLIVETDSPDVQIRVRSAAREVDLIFTKEKKQVPLRLGKYTLELVKGMDGFRLSTNEFEIRDDQKTVRVKFVPLMAEKKDALPPEVSIADLLKTREVLAVAQDGSERFKTIGAALDAVQSNQVILVKDQGPYRESLSKSVPANVALVSLVGTRVEIPEYHSWFEQADKKKFYYGAWLNVQPGFRMSGLQWSGSAARPKDALSGMLVSIVPEGELTIDGCSFHAPDYLGALSLRSSWTSRSARRIVQDNFARQTLEFHELPGSLVIRRNFVEAEHRAVTVQQRSAGVQIRDNVLLAPWGITVNHAEPSKKAESPGMDLHIQNNVVESTYAPIGFFKNTEFETTLPRRVRIANNILRSREDRGIVMTPEEREAMKGRLHIGPNAYLAEPKQQPGASNGPHPLGPGDVVAAKHFLSIDPRSTDYLRIAADGPLAKGGAGGEQPSYFGAFPPGPAPKEGDWFTRLLESAKRPAFAWPARALQEGRITAPDLAKARKLFHDEFDDPQSGWPVGKHEVLKPGSGLFCHVHYEKGRYTMKIDALGGTGVPTRLFHPGGDLVCSIEGRILSSTADRWEMVLPDEKKRVAFVVMIDGRGEFLVTQVEFGKDHLALPLASGTHAAIKKGSEFNKVTVILRARRLELFVNEVAVCDPITLDIRLEPAHVGLGLRGDKAHAEFERITVWSTDGLPTAEERRSQLPDLLPGKNNER